MKKPNPEKFPCEDNQYKSVRLMDCERCKRRDQCDTYVTMLNETEWEDE